jgi:hypothetical protein
MKKFASNALNGALAAAIAATTIAISVEAASAKSIVPYCTKVGLGSDKSTARQIASTWRRLGPMSGLCAAPK